MRTRRLLHLTLAWLLLSAMLIVFLFTASQSVLDDAVKDQVGRHLLLSLDEAPFGSAKSRSDDQEGLRRIGQEINQAMLNLIADRWYSPQKECVVRLLRLDDVTISEEPMRRNISFGLVRNQLDREVVLGMSCSADWWIALSAAGILGLLFAAIYLALPAPLTRAHRQWINYLLERGYSGAAAFEIVRRYGPDSLVLSAAQMSCLEQLHDSEQRNFSYALEVVTAAGTAALEEDAIDWFLLGLRNDPGNTVAALGLAAADNVVVIDLTDMNLSIRGLSIPISGTPLFYYAWYAMSRIRGEGWITNPASNRPDKVFGRELVELMSRYEGHAKAINDLERTGLKARTLDQNRNKIKDDIVAALGEKLAAAYLFETSKHPDGLHMRYRLSLDSSSLRIIAGP